MLTPEKLSVSPHLYEVLLLPGAPRTPPYGANPMDLNKAT